ncbi:hypothetical protein CHARACLAT_011969 [Characodon lateralis]|uniref:Uncharacterized protein n=1 Tax=Characodon lateralis TaxID=208331 RepID=A0ABU7ET65_9TELE|nr:hypothetical protein [Characodon lateralis]
MCPPMPCSQFGPQQSQNVTDSYHDRPKTVPYWKSDSLLFQLPRSQPGPLDFFQLGSWCTLCPIKSNDGWYCYSFWHMCWMSKWSQLSMKEPGFYYKGECNLKI